MNHADFQLQGVIDPRLAVHATSALPAWLWSSDGTRILWANPVGARLFGAVNGAALPKKIFGPADQHRRQVAQLAGRLPSDGTIRMQRLRGFGASLGRLVTCGCARLDFADGSRGILVVAAESAGRAMPLTERLQRLVESIDAPATAFTRDGKMVGANEAARALPSLGDLAEAGFDEARSIALKQGRAELTLADLDDLMVLQRVGSGADAGLLALPARSIELPTVPETVAPIPDDEAPAGFALIDEFAESPVESMAAEPAAEANVPARPHEPSLYVEAVTDEPNTGSDGQPVAATPAPPIGQPTPRRLPLRFVWRMDADGRFSLGSGEFTRLIGERSAVGFGLLWSDIAEVFGLDPDGSVAKAIATRETWSGITVNWPADGGARLPVDLSGLPVFDAARRFNGYRGFGVCRDLDGLTRLDALRRHELAGTPATDPPAETPTPASIAPETSQPTDVETPVETPNETPQEAPDEALKNVLPFRPIGEPKSPILTPVENSAFNELARQLSARLDTDNGAPETTESAGAAVDAPAAPEAAEAASEQPEWLAPSEAPARGETRRDRTLLDLLPVGVLIYRLDRLLYANRAFLDRMGYENLYALEEAGGLDALYVEPGVSSASSTSNTGTPVTISASQVSGEVSSDQSSPQQTPVSATEAHLFTISWDGDSALALIFSGARTEGIAAAIAATAPVAVAQQAGHASAEELGAILDTTAEGVVMFDAKGNIHSCNRSAEALFGYDGPELVQYNLTELFAPESQRAIKEYLESTGAAGAASLLDHGREALGRVQGGGIIPLSVTIGRTQPNSPNFFAVFRDLSQSKKSESELQQARRLNDRAASAKSDMLARVSHEVRTPLNAIIGFAEVMIAERFGKLGNDRYVEYMKDIRASGERVIAIIDDLLDLSRIETGKLDLTFANQNLNDLVEQCVAVMQPQANRERIIIRTSLAHMLPPVLADARALRQIALNLISSSIHLANAGGQVIVSTALSDFGGVALRVRDTGHGLNESEVAAALEPFRTAAPSDQASEGAGVSLSLTKALVEANRAKFQIKAGAHSGTLIEVLFAHATARV